MRVYCTKKNLDDCLQWHFLRVSKLDNKILPHAIVEDLIEKQLAVIAMDFFSEEVEKAMHKLEEEDIEKELLKKPEERKKSHEVPTLYIVFVTGTRPVTAEVTVQQNALNAIGIL